MYALEAAIVDIHVTHQCTTEYWMSAFLRAHTVHGMAHLFAPISLQALAQLKKYCPQMITSIAESCFFCIAFKYRHKNKHSKSVRTIFSPSKYINKTHTKQLFRLQHVLQKFIRNEFRLGVELHYRLNRVHVYSESQLTGTLRFLCYQIKHRFK